MWFYLKNKNFYCLTIKYHFNGQTEKKWFYEIQSDFHKDNFISIKLYFPVFKFVGFCKLVLKTNYFFLKPK